MCDVCDRDIGHLDGCPLDYGTGGDYYDNADDEGGSFSCSVCGSPIAVGDAYIYDPDTDGIVCSECIEEFSVSDILEICGLSSVTEALSVFSGKVMKRGDIY